MRGKSILLSAIGAAALFASGPGPALAVDQPALILATAYDPIGESRYKAGGEGPTAFDCSGFVWWTFNSAGMADLIGGRRMLAREYQKWFRYRGQLFTDRRQAKVGDLAFWGSPAKHVGVVTRIVTPLRKSRPLKVFVTSAIVGQGIREYRFDLLVAPAPFSNFAHTGLVNLPDPTPTPTPTPTPSPTPEPTTGPTPTPTAEPTPTPEPTIEVTTDPTATPTPSTEPASG